MHVIRPTAPPTKATLGPTNAATTPGARPPSLLGRHHRARRQQPAVLVAKVVAIAALMAAPTDGRPADKAAAPDRRDRRPAGAAAPPLATIAWRW